MAEKVCSESLGECRCDGSPVQAGESGTASQKTFGLRLNKKLRASKTRRRAGKQCSWQDLCKVRREAQWRREGQGAWRQRQDREWRVAGGASGEEVGLAGSHGRSVVCT